LTSFCFKDESVNEMISQGHFELLINDFLAKRSFVLVASAHPLNLFSREQDGGTPSNTNATRGNANYSTLDDGEAPKGSAFAIIGTKRRDGTLFVKMSDKWDMLTSKGQYAPASPAWTAFLQHEFEYDPSLYE